MPEKCALSHGSGVLGRDPRDSCRFWSPHVENMCTVTQIRLGEGGGWGYPFGGGGVGEPRSGIKKDAGLPHPPPPPWYPPPCPAPPPPPCGVGPVGWGLWWYSSRPFPRTSLGFAVVPPPNLFGRPWHRLLFLFGFQVFFGFPAPSPCLGWHLHHIYIYIYIYIYVNELYEHIRFLL